MMSIKRILTTLFLALFALSALAAATVEERSAFRQGHWWDPTRSGHGFEILSNAGQVFVVWYTYDQGGRPTWYTAQGTQDGMGGAWPLQKHRWGDGRIEESTNVGVLRLSVNHFESLTASWQVDGGQGTWKLEPFVESGTVNEVDLTGHWYDPTNSGWGMTLLDQGDVFGAVIYAYDAAGAPTWVAGFDRGKGTHVDLRWTRGSCPSCAYRIVGSEPAGSLEVAYSGDTEITLRSSLTVPMAPGVRIDGAHAFQLGRPASARRVDFQLAPFGSAAALKAFMAAGMEHRYFGSAGSDFSPAPPGAGPVSFSTTNVQEAGVDEADVMKTDGRYVYAVTPAFNDMVAGVGADYYRKVRVAYVGDGGATLEPRGEFRIASTPGYNYGEANLYLHAGTLVTLSSPYYYGGWYYSPDWKAETHIEFLAVANPAAPASRMRATLSGTIVSSRRIGDRLYVVTRFTPNVPGYVSYAYTDAMRASNRALLDAAPLESLLPTISIDGGAPVPVVGTGSVYAPQRGGTYPVADLVVIHAFDIREGRFVDALAIAGRTEAMYVSTGNLYLASSRYETRATAGGPQPLQPSLLSTDIHQIALGTDGMRLVGSGSIEGWVGYGDKAAFRFGEDNGRLGVVSSTTTGWWGNNSNRVTLLAPSKVAPGLLKTISWLPNSRRPQTLGKPNELLYGTRFVGDRLYAVTFKKTDPLYIVDLADRADPRISGELAIPGFSDYLHPLPNGLMLGFGKDAVPADTTGDAQFAWFQGLQLTLFDVSGAAPREINRVLVGKRGSNSPLFASHHAFSALTLADGRTRVAFPAAINDGEPPYGYSGPTTYYPWQYSGLLHFEVLGTTPADARLVQTRTLVSSQATGTQTYPPNGDGYYEPGRSVLFPDASIYVSAGKIWRQDGTGATTGPY